MVTAAATQQPETTQNKQAAAVEAYAHIHGRVYAPVFFEKLAADYGVQPADEDECRELLTMATKLRTVHDTVQQKQASTQTANRKTFLKTAHQNLDSVMAQHGLAVNQPQTQNHEQDEVKAAAASLTLDPQISQAVLQMLAATV